MNPALASLGEICNILENTSDEMPLPKQDGVNGRLNQNILFGICRGRAYFDWLMERLSSSKIRLRLRRILWWGMVQILNLNGLPPPVVVDTCCQYAKRRYSRAEAGFINAFLHRLLEVKNNSGLPELLEAPEWVQAGLPEIIWQRWCVQFGKAKAMELGKLLQLPANITCRRRSGITVAEIPDFLSEIPDCDWCPEHYVYERVADVKKNIPMDKFYIQDSSTLMAPLWIEAKPGEHIADFCSAPGGKSLIMAEAMNGSGSLLCCDKSGTRLERVKENLASFGNVKYLAIDVSAAENFPDAPFDAILLDVPCSNTGVIRRRPDVRWTFGEEKLAEIIKIQKTLLEQGARMLKSGGRLVYSTCSIENEENCGQVEEFMKSHREFSLVRQRQLLPDKWHDGGYAALLRKE